MAVFTPLPEKLPLDAVRDVNARLTNVEIETQLNGGYGVARIGMLAPDAPRPLRLPMLPRPMPIQKRAHVEISIGEHLIHEGVLWEAEGEASFSTMGYGAYGPWNELESAQSDLAPMGTILRDAVRLYAPLIAPSTQFADTGVLHTWTEFNDRALHEVLEQLTSEGDGLTPYAWAVYEQRALRVFALSAPATATYRLSVGPGVVVRRSFADVYDACRVRYQDSSGTAQLTTWVYAVGVDTTSLYLRRKTLPGGTLSSTAAALYARTWIAVNGMEAIDAQITVPEWGLLQLSSGGVRHAYLARAGETVAIEGYGTGFLTRTTASLTTGMTNLALGKPSPQSFAGLLRRVQETTEASRGGLSPITGSRRGDGT